ncbi:MAG TPA: GNAT family N-acetyltransferase, partial [Pseudonocardiaceae bacterium]|nr:GNAT family N-acetyltransferase [Pseudonocardiaceae bacterium]
MAPARVRAATAEDVGTLTALHRSIWRVAYRELLPPETLDTLDSPGVRQAWAETVAGGATVLLATEGDEPVGFVVAGLAPDAEVAAADGSLPADA